jgi:hypothetical protein
MAKVKRILLIVVALLVVLAIGGAVFVFAQVSSFDSSMAKVYAVPPLPLVASKDPAVIARGKHLAESVAGCAVADCHGLDLSAGKVIELGPLGRMAAPNITAGSMGAAYSDGELARLVRHGVKKDGTSVFFMPAHEMNWLPDEDLTAIISYLRTVPPSTKPNNGSQIGVMLKVMDRMGMMKADIARQIDHEHVELAPPPEPTAKYGKFLMRECTGCHGEGLAGGKIPGTPPSIPIPKNLTMHETGLKGWTFEDFAKTLETGASKDGRKLNKFMPFEGYGRMNEVEKRALWAALNEMPPRAFGER